MKILKKVKRKMERIRITKRDKLIPVDENLKIGDEVLILTNQELNPGYIFHDVSKIRSEYGTYWTYNQHGSFQKQGYRLEDRSDEAIFEKEKLFFFELEKEMYPLIKVTKKQLTETLLMELGIYGIIDVQSVIQKIISKSIDNTQLNVLDRVTENSEKHIYIDG